MHADANREGKAGSQVVGEESERFQVLLPVVEGRFLEDTFGFTDHVVLLHEEYKYSQQWSQYDSAPESPGTF